MHRHSAAAAIIAYALLTVTLTWPLARGITKDVPADFGDPLLNAWVLAWDAEHMLRAISGNPGALREYWNANIFHPHPLALAYSEHLTPQAAMILPVWALTKNPILCHNLVFLSPLLLSALGMFLFTRTLTSSPGAAFVAGIAFGFAPYRFGTMSHVQVLSAMWMPFTLLGDWNVYAAFYDFVPGFDGLRVPARFAMIAALGLATLAGLGAALFERRRHGLARTLGLTHRCGIVGRAHSRQHQLDRLRASRPGTPPRHRAARIGGPDGISLPRRPAALECRDGAAFRRGRLRSTLHVLFDAALEASGEWLQWRSARPVQFVGRPFQGFTRPTPASLAGRGRVARDAYRGARRQLLGGTQAATARA